MWKTHTHTGVRGEVIWWFAPQMPRARPSKSQELRTQSGSLTCVAETEIVEPWLLPPGSALPGYWIKNREAETQTSHTVTLIQDAGIPSSDLTTWPNTHSFTPNILILYVDIFIIQGYIKELQFVEKELKDEFILMEKYLKFMAMRESLKSSWKHVLLKQLCMDFRFLYQNFYFYFTTFLSTFLYVFWWTRKRY